MLYRTARLFTSTAGALFGLAVWMLSPDVLRLGINGLETSLALFLERLRPDAAGMPA